MRSAPYTFESSKAAEKWLTEADLIHGKWIDPEQAKILLGSYAERWITERPALRPRTVELHRWLLGKYIEPRLGGVKLAALVREWRSDLLAAGVSQTMAAKAYRLLRAILTTAVDEDGILSRNPAASGLLTGRTRRSDRFSLMPRCSSSPMR